MNCEAPLNIETIQVNIDIDADIDDSQLELGGESVNVNTSMSATDSDGIVEFHSSHQTIMPSNFDESIDKTCGSQLFQQRRKSCDYVDDGSEDAPVGFYRTYSGSFQDCHKNHFYKQASLNVTADSGIVSDGSLMKSHSGMPALRMTHSMCDGRGNMLDRKRAASWQDSNQSFELSRHHYRFESSETDTMNQMEEAYKISNELFDKDDQIETLMRDNAFLSSEIQSLEAELLSKESELNEYRLIIREQQSQLTNQRSTAADCKIESEKFKVENMAKTGIEEISQALLNQALSENEELKHEMQVVNHESAKLHTENQRLQRENIRLTTRLQKAKSEFFDSAHISQKSCSLDDKIYKTCTIDEDDTIEALSSSSAPAAPPRTKRWLNENCAAVLEEDRNKQELLKTIRQIKEDKIVWEQYACFLLRNIVETDINLLRRKNKSEAKITHPEKQQEDNWEKFSKSLVNYVLKRQPQLLNDFMTKSDIKINGKDILI